jgi:hypothetical protein
MSLVKSRFRSKFEKNSVSDLGQLLNGRGEHGDIVVRRAGSVSSEDIHRALFPAKPRPARTVDEMDEGIRKRARERYARR